MSADILSATFIALFTGTTILLTPVMRVKKQPNGLNPHYLSLRAWSGKVSNAG